MIQHRDNAVSPVIAIMLMLVVTIIIAAVVSGFAGGLAGSQEKTPQATISAEYSQSRGMSISHDGGDVLAVADLQVESSPTRVWGAGADYQTYFVNKSVLNTNNTIWAPVDSQYIKVKAFGPGDQASVSLANITYIQSDAMYKAANNIKTTSSSSYANAANLGKTFTLKFMDARTSKIIAQTEVKIVS
jgi:archaeal type IV pilus assembly protein PilA